MAFFFFFLKMKVKFKFVQKLVSAGLSWFSGPGGQVRLVSVQKQGEDKQNTYSMLAFIPTRGDQKAGYL